MIEPRWIHDLHYIFTTYWSYCKRHRRSQESHFLVLDCRMTSHGGFHHPCRPSHVKRHEMQLTTCDLGPHRLQWRVSWPSRAPKPDPHWSSLHLAHSWLNFWLLISLGTGTLTLVFFHSNHTTGRVWSSYCRLLGLHWKHLSGNQNRSPISLMFTQRFIWLQAGCTLYFLGRHLRPTWVVKAMWCGFLMKLQHPTKAGIGPLELEGIEISAVKNCV